jgi:hypothetical protein
VEFGLQDADPGGVVVEPRGDPLDRPAS